MSYWGQDTRHYDDDGNKIKRWKVRQDRRGNTVLYVVWEPDGDWSGVFNEWSEAMDWATSFSVRVEYWLRNGVLG